MVVMGVVGVRLLVVVGVLLLVLRLLLLAVAVVLLALLVLRGGEEGVVRGGPSAMRRRRSRRDTHVSTCSQASRRSSPSSTAIWRTAWRGGSTGPRGRQRHQHGTPLKRKTRNRGGGRTRRATGVPQTEPEQC